MLANKRGIVLLYKITIALGDRITRFPHRAPVIAEIAHFDGAKRLPIWGRVAFAAAQNDEDGGRCLFPVGGKIQGFVRPQGITRANEAGMLGRGGKNAACAKRAQSKKHCTANFQGGGGVSFCWRRDNGGKGKAKRLKGPRRGEFGVVFAPARQAVRGGERGAGLALGTDFIVRVGHGTVDTRSVPLPTIVY